MTLTANNVGTIQKAEIKRKLTLTKNSQGIFKKSGWIVIFLTHGLLLLSYDLVLHINVSRF